MATTQQIKMLLARAHEAGVKANWADFADLNNGDIDNKLEDIRRLKEGIEGHMKTKAKVNDIRFGMCAKIVANQMTIGNIEGNTHTYTAKVLSLYRSVEAAFKAVSTSKPQPDPHKIALTPQEECADLEGI